MSLVNYITTWGVTIGHWELCSMCCRLLHIPTSNSIKSIRKQKDRERGRKWEWRMTWAFFSTFFVSLWNHVQPWQKCDRTVMPKTTKLAHILICQESLCLGSVGGALCLCVLVFLFTCDWRCMCIMHALASLHACLSPSSCQLNLSFKNQ